MTSTTRTPSSYSNGTCACSHQTERAPSARLIIAAGILVTVAIGLTLVIAGEHAADVARSSWGTVASVLRSSWG